ncbi:MAG TPA: hypothetical protein VNI84_18990 [Pyrinomonadaceae bacterium]|nr:hypothetical protein [Pyrinomonadaceae bacterium]
MKTIFYELTEKFYHSANEFEFCQSDFEFLINKFGKTREVIAEEIKEFVGDDKQPEFHAYYADYDWVVFCWLFGRMTDLPKGFPKYCRDLKQMLDDAVGTMPKGFDNAVYDDRAKGYTLEDLKNLPDYPKQENEHNALDDARWNKSLFDFLNSLK